MLFIHSLLLAVASAYPIFQGLNNTELDDGISSSNTSIFSNFNSTASNSSVHIVNNAVEMRVKSYSYAEFPITYEGVAYFIDAQVGSNKDTVRMLFDTGSSYTWVRSSDMCDNASTDCSGYGSYDYEKSTTMKDKKKELRLSYGDGSWYDTEVVTDSFWLGDYQFSNQYLELDKDSWSSIGGLMALSINVRSKQLISKFQKVFNTQKQGFSVYLGPKESNFNGSLLFGAIDYDKIDGNFTALKLTNWRNQYKGATNWTVASRGISYDGKTIVDQTYPAMLDTGTTNLGVPTAVWENITSTFGATEENGNWVLDCPSNDKNLTFYFDNNLSINVEASSLVDTYGDKCYFDGINDNGPVGYILGDSFMRYSYVYHDAHKDAIMMGQAKYSNTKNIKIMTEDVDAIHP
ncbi:hypothetical protein DASC09_063010 [Saccharomycopsis crataegensis]|uniref:Peptidase A1 domain-containing protein n=1 Tax=Saccharomycopsis crataegensis TaxID=43959 RepID=A0AAV5QWX5_9ASCO|nr:hypothetical protein DASC09_063010 [Saccharomycopsis crataegensis]